MSTRHLHNRLLEKHLEQRPWEAGYDVGVASTKAEDLPERTGKRLGDQETKDGAGFR